MTKSPIPQPLADAITALKKSISDYGKPGGPWNVPNEPGTWIRMATEALAALEAFAGKDDVVEKPTKTGVGDMLTTQMSSPSPTKKDASQDIGMTLPVIDPKWSWRLRKTKRISHDGAYDKFDFMMQSGGVEKSCEALTLNELFIDIARIHKQDGGK